MLWLCFLPPFLAFKATGGLKIPSSFQDPQRIRAPQTGGSPRPWSPCLLWKAHSAPAESPLGPGASQRMPSWAPWCRHRQRAAHCGGARGCTPSLRLACSQATRSAFIIPDDKAYCPEEFKAPSNRLPHGQESRHCLFPRVTSPPLALPAPPFLSLSPTHHPLFSLTSYLFFPSQNLFHFLYSLFCSFSFPILFSSPWGSCVENNLKPLS